MTKAIRTLVLASGASFGVLAFVMEVFRIILLKIAKSTGMVTVRQQK